MGFDGAKVKIIFLSAKYLRKKFVLNFVGTMFGSLMGKVYFCSRYEKSQGTEESCSRDICADVAEVVQRTWS